MHIEFKKGLVLAVMCNLTREQDSLTVNIKNKMPIYEPAEKKELRKTITALTKDGFIIPQSTFGSTYTLNIERINQISFK